MEFVKITDKIVSKGETRDMTLIDNKILNSYCLDDAVLKSAMIQIGKRISEEREKQNYTIADISLMTNLDVAHLYRIEKGERSIGLKVLMKISFCLNCPIDTFIPFEAKRQLTTGERFELATAGASQKTINELLKLAEVYTRYNNEENK